MKWDDGYNIIWTLWIFTQNSEIAGCLWRQLTRYPASGKEVGFIKNCFTLKGDKLPFVYNQNMKSFLIVLMGSLLFGIMVNIWFFKITLNSYNYLQAQKPTIQVIKQTKIKEVNVCPTCPKCESWTDMPAEELLDGE